jgi:hypothetical protein
MKSLRQAVPIVAVAVLLQADAQRSDAVQAGTVLKRLIQR